MSGESAEKMFKFVFFLAVIVFFSIDYRHLSFGCQILAQLLPGNQHSWRCNDQLIVSH
jgi:hypothetical protein